MNKRRSLLDDVPSIDERLRDQLADGKKQLRSGAKGQAVLAVFVLAGTIGSAFRSGQWTLRHWIGLLIVVATALFARSMWRRAHEADV